MKELSDEELIARITKVAIIADNKLYGGSSLKWVIDCFLPELKKHNLMIVDSLEFQVSVQVSNRCIACHCFVNEVCPEGICRNCHKGLKWEDCLKNVSQNTGLNFETRSHTSEKEDERAG